MTIKRIIPCLDIKNGRVVKGTSFIELKDAGDPVEFAAFYDKEGADELVFLDITATTEKRKTVLDLAARTAKEVTIPFIIGGGINKIEDMKEVLQSGASKVSINTSAVENPALIKAGAQQFGGSKIIVAIDAKRKDLSSWEVVTRGGSKSTGLDVCKWAKEVEKLDAGEILLTSMDTDGREEGYDIELTRAVTDSVKIPVIASGGAGKLEHLRDVIIKGGASAVLAASIFHFRQFTIRQAKEYLRSEGIEVRL